MTSPSDKARVTVTEDGPYIVTGDVPLAKQTIVLDGDGGSEAWREGEALPHKATYALCRCGASAAKPFCDGSHGPTGMRPMFVEITESKQVSWCGCKTSSDKPFCDGSHKKLA